jgi:hypothetical protein
VWGVEVELYCRGTGSLQAVRLMGGVEL